MDDITPRINTSSNLVPSFTKSGFRPKPVPNFPPANNQNILKPKPLVKNEKHTISTNKNSKDRSKKKNHLLLKLLIPIGIILFIPFIIGLSGYFYLESLINQDALNKDQKETITFTIHTGETAYTISKNLKKDNITTNQYTFYYYVKKNDLGSKIRAGDYEITPNKTDIKDLTKLFTEAPVVDTITVTIPEGYTSKQIESRLIESGFTIQEGELTNLANYKGEGEKEKNKALWEIYLKFEQKYSFIKNQPNTKYKGLEGYLFPDTYTFKKEVTLEEIIDTMLSTFQKKVMSDSVVVTKSQGKDFHESIILASIVQREAGKTLEVDKKVAGVFLNRLDINMALESCSTLQYVTETNKDRYEESDINTVSPYNTYKNAGLPPGPIANPGLQAIQATLDSENHDYLFFFNTSSGELIFSKTFAEHNQKQVQYQ